MQSQTASNAVAVHNQVVPNEAGHRCHGASEGGKLFFIALRCGRLANRLVIFANFIAMAEEQGHRLINFTFHSYAHLFEETHANIYCQYPAAKRRGLFDVVPGLSKAIRGTRVFYHATRSICVLHDKHGILGRRAVRMREINGENFTPLDGAEIQSQINGARIVFVYDWKFRAPNWVQRHADKIRHHLRPIAELENASAQALQPLRQNSDIVVGVHIRHGDYRTFRGGKFFFPASRYAEWMREMTGKFPGRRVSFYVCSDEPRSREEFGGLTVGFGPGSPVADLYALAKCDYVIGPVSTFSQWASFYGNKPLFHLSGTKDRLEPGSFAVSYLAEIP